ncbi:MAG: DUF4404 family protein [Pirellulaceae bacterium]|nr:DUF4404 family protein [Pirellulaceae bacterium]
MSSEELSRKLQELHQELLDNPAIDAKAVQSLKAVLGDIQLALDRAKEQDAQPVSPESPVSGRLQVFIEEFEAHHPRLTLTLSNIADQLSAMGF